MRSGLFYWSAYLWLLAFPAWGQSSAKLIHFTVDGKAGGPALFPGFTLRSCWSAISASSAGNIYIGIANHEQPAQASDVHGNVALFKYLPAQDSIRLLGDLKSASQTVNNWMTDESQHKVHTCLWETANHRMYFASDDYAPSYYLRGAHLYYIDLDSNDRIVDFSQTQPKVMKRDFSVINNSGTLSDTSGVFIQYYGIKGLSLNQRVPDLLYAMTYPDGYLIKYNFSTGAMARIGQSPTVSYVFYTDNSGNAWYTASDGTNQDLKKYTVATGVTTTVKDNYTDLRNGYNEGWGMVAPTAGGDTVYCLSTAGSNYGGADIWRLVCSQEKFEYVVTLCGIYTWKMFNMTLAPDGKKLYFVSCSTDGAVKYVLQVDMGGPAPVCDSILDISSVVGDRTLCFGGINTWDQSGNFYVPVWRFSPEPTNVALMQVHIGTPGAITGKLSTAGHQADATLQVYPSPANSQTTIKLITPDQAQAIITLADMHGTLIKTFHHDGGARGPYYFHWDGRDESGQAVLPGIYFCHLNGILAQKVFITR
jgi:hypothetical protein